MKVFMLGWEFPPYISGGLGTACYGLTRGLDQSGVEVSFVLPMAVPQQAASHVTLRTPSTLTQARAKARGKNVVEELAVGFEHVTMHVVPAILQPYGNPASFQEALARLRKLHALTEGEEAILSIPPAAMGGSAQAGRYEGDLM